MKKLSMPSWVLLAVMACAPSLPARAAATQKIGLRYLTSVRATEISSGQNAVASGNTAFLAAGANGLEIFDVTDRVNARFVGSVSRSALGGFSAFDVQISGNLACVATGEGLQIVDISDLANPKALGKYRTSGNAMTLAIAGHNVFIPAGDAGFKIIDITDPKNTSLAGSYPRSLVDAPLYASDLRVKGDYAFVAAGDEGLVVFRISNLDNITAVAKLSLGSGAFAIDLAGSTVCVAGGSGHFWTIDISAPTQPKLLGSYLAPGADSAVAWKLQVTGNFAFVAAGQGGVQVIDLSDLTKPTAAGGFGTFDEVQGIFIANNLAIVGDGNAGFRLFEVVPGPVSLPVILEQPESIRVPQGTPAQFSVQASAESALAYQWLFKTAPLQGANSATFTLDQAWPAQDGAYAVVVSSTGGSVLSSAADLKAVHPPVIGTPPANQRLVEGETLSLQVTANTDGPGEYQWLKEGANIPGATNSSFRVENLSSANAGNYAVIVSNIAGAVTSASGTVQVLPKVVLKEISKWPEVIKNENVWDVQVAGRLAFLAAGPAGLLILDVADPAKPVQIGALATKGYSYGLDVKSPYVYLADGLNGGLAVVDVRDPKNPVRLIRVTTGTEVRDVKVVGNLAYVAAGEGGLVIVDVTDPANPQLVSNEQTPMNARAIDVAGDLACVAEWDWGMTIYNVSNPAKPVVEDTMRPSLFNLGFSVYAVQIVGKSAYAGIAYDGFEIYDLSNPHAPTSESVFDTPGFAEGVHVDGDHVFIGDASSGVQVIDVGDLDRPRRVGSWDTAGEAGAIDLSNGFAFVADGSKGLVILSVSSNSQTTQPFQLECAADSSAGQIRLRVPASAAGGPVVLHASTDLTRWAPVATNSVAVGGFVEFVQQPGLEAPVMFYRAAR